MTSASSAAQFAGKVALVTGGGSGIGRAASRRLADEGAAVLVADMNADAAAATVAAITAAGGSAAAITADVSSEADTLAMFDAAERDFGGIDVAFLNAGRLQPYIPFDETSLELFEAVMAVNLRGAFLGIREASRRLRPGGACVVTASDAALVGFGIAAAYSASKHGVVGLVRSAAELFAGRSLRINAICPGMVQTGMIGSDELALVDPSDLADPPYRGGLSAQHIAEFALFLLSRRASGMNGQLQVVDAALLSAFPPMP